MVRRRYRLTRLGNRHARSCVPNFQFASWLRARERSGRCDGQVRGSCSISARQTAIPLHGRGRRASCGPSGVQPRGGRGQLWHGRNVLRWIADRLTGDMITLEAGAGLSTVLFATLARHHYCCTGSQLETDKIRDYLERIGVSPEKVTFILGSTDDTL